MPNKLFWLGGLGPFRGPAASETLDAQISEIDSWLQAGRVKNGANWQEALSPQTQELLHSGGGHVHRPFRSSKAHLGAPPFLRTTLLLNQRPGVNRPS